MKWTSYLIHGDGQEDDVQEENDDDGTNKGKSESVTMRQPTKTLRSISSRVVQQLGNYDGNTNDHQWKSVSEDEKEENHNEMMEDLSFRVAIHIWVVTLILAT